MIFDPMRLPSPRISAECPGWLFPFRPAASDTAVEVSSAGLHKAVAEIYPAPEFLQLFYEAGVAITTASDAHYPQECARDFDEIKRYARAAGYSERVRFRRGQREAVPL